MIIYMLSQTLLESDDDIDYLKYWKRTLAYRVLKNGGRFFCLEFSKVDNSSLEFLYNQYSR